MEAHVGLGRKKMLVRTNMERQTKTEIEDNLKLKCYKIARY